MTHARLVFTGLWRRPMRTLLTMTCIVTAFLLYGGLYGVTASFDNLLNQLSDTRLYIQNRAHLLAGLPLSYAERVRQVGGVTAVGYYQPVPVYLRDPQNKISMGAVNFDEFLKVSPNIVLPAEQREVMLRTRTGAVAGKALAARWGWQIGDRVTLISSTPPALGSSPRSWELDIVGIYDNKLASNDVYINFEYLDAGRTSGKGRALMFFAGIDAPTQAARIAQNIDWLFANSGDATQTQNEKDWMRGQVEQIGNLQLFINAVMGAVLFTILFVTANTMMQSIRERIPEFAIMKTYGYTDSGVLLLVAAEALLLCLTAALLGLGLAALLFPAIYSAMGLGGFPIPTSVIALGIGIAIVLALVSALPPSWRVHRLSIVDALAGR